MRVVRQLQTGGASDNRSNKIRRKSDDSDSEDQ